MVFKTISIGSIPVTLEITTIGATTYDLKRRSLFFTNVKILKKFKKSFTQPNNTITFQKKPRAKAFLGYTSYWPEERAAKAYLNRNYLFNFLWHGTVRRHPSYKFKNLTTLSIINDFDRAVDIALFNVEKRKELLNNRKNRQHMTKVSIFSPREQIEKWRKQQNPAQQNRTLLFVPTLQKSTPPYLRRPINRDFQKFKNKAIRDTSRLLSYRYQRLDKTSFTRYFSYYPRCQKKLNQQTLDGGVITTHLTLRTLLKSILLKSKFTTAGDSAIVRNRLTPTLTFSYSQTIRNFVALLQIFTKSKQDRRISRRNWLTRNLPTSGVYSCNDVGYFWRGVEPLWSHKTLSIGFNQPEFWDYLSNTSSLGNYQALNPFNHNPLNLEITFYTHLIPELLLKLFIYNHLQTPHLLATSLRALLYQENVFSRKLSQVTTPNLFKTVEIKNQWPRSHYSSYYIKSKNTDRLHKSLANYTYCDSSVENLRLRAYLITITNQKRVAFLCNNPTLYLKYSPFSTKVHLSLIHSQLNINKISSLVAYDHSKMKTKLKPTIFTYKTWAHRYRSREILTANPSGRHYYWNTSEESSSIHTHHSLIQTTFLLNWNENLWENSIFTQTNLQIGATSTSETTHPLSIYERRLVRLLGARVKVSTQLEVDRVLRNNKSGKLRILLYYLNFNLKQISTSTNTRLARLLFFKLKKHTVYRTSAKPLKRISNIIHRPLKQLKQLTQARQTFEYSLLSLSKSSTNRHLMARYIQLVRGVKKQLIFLLSPKLKEKLDLAFNEVVHQKLVSQTEQLTVGVIQKFEQIKKLKNQLKRYWRLIHSNKLLNSKRWLSRLFDLNRYQKSWDSLGADLLPNGNADQDHDSLDYNQLHSLRSNFFIDERSSADYDSGENSINLVQKHAYRNLVVQASMGSLASEQTYLNFANATPELRIKGVVTSQNSSIGCLTQQLLTNLFFLNNSLNNTLLFKYLLVKSSEFTNLPNYYLRRSLVSVILHNLETMHFGSRLQLLRNSNISPTPVLNVTIKRRLLKFFTMRKFSIKISFWYFNMLVRFIEYCTGRKVYLQLNPHIENSLTLVDEAQCFLWENQIFSFHKILGPKFFLNESLRIFLLALKNKDPNLLINWIKTMLYRMSFWKYRVLFRYVKHVIKNLFEPKFGFFGLRGFKLKLKGKISVGGNSRTRTLLIRIGRTSNSCFNNKVTHSSTLIYSFTGVMGFNVWIYF